MGGEKDRERRRRRGTPESELESDQDKDQRRARSASPEDSQQSSERERGRGGDRRRDMSKKRSKRDASDESEEEDDRRSKKSRPSRRKRDESDNESASDEEERRRREKKRSRRRIEKRDEASETASSSEEERPKKKRNKEITKEQMEEYLKKKAQRKAAKLAKKLKSAAVAGYSNDNNPFGDANLSETFVWKKKIEKDVAAGKDLKDLSLKAEKRRIKERMAEVEKVKKRREEREREKAAHEEEMAMLARERARAEYADFEKKEEEFHYEQTKVRAGIRLKEGRAKPIDILSKNLSLDEDFDVEINEPYTIFKGLSVEAIEELRTDIQQHLEFDRATQTHIDFWQAMMVCCNNEIAEKKRHDALLRAHVRGEEPPPEYANDGLHKAVDKEVQEMLTGKSSSELITIEDQIEQRMEEGSAKVVEYWEAVLKRLKVYKARARLRDIHADLLRRHLARLQESTERDRQEMAAALEEQRGFRNESPALSDIPEEAEPIYSDAEDPPPGQNPPPGQTPPPSTPLPQGALNPDELALLKRLIDEDEMTAEAGAYTPDLRLTGPYKEEEVVDPEEDKLQEERRRVEVLQRERKKLKAIASRPRGEENSEVLTSAERAAAIKVMGGLDEADANFGGEVGLSSQTYWWHDKYRPRKPKYFNRVHTGYEWNKYNQTHYDHDNPPPKIVQGYKFNIFYPDLIDKVIAPTYVIEKDKSSKDGETCLIRFTAGPPYEDIAFRIVNKEWEYSHKKGFKSTFERGILHVYFNFKRFRYRR